MNAKWYVIGTGLAVCLISAGNLLSSPQSDSQPKAKSKQTDDQPKSETEVAVLQEKVAALKRLHDFQVAAKHAGRGTMIAIYRVDCDWKMAEAELAAVRGNHKEQIQFIEEAVKMVDGEVKSLEQLFRGGETTTGDLTEAIVRRADTKLALIRAKKQNAR